jgi:uncharacterized lipoprotein YmbA
MIRSSKFLTVLGLAAGLGCMHPSQPVVFHTLQPLPGQGAPARPGAIALEVLPVRLPELLRRPQMVVAQGPSAVRLLESDRWGNPLDQDMQRVLVADLTQLLGGDGVVASPYGERVAALYRLEVEVQSCDPRGGAGLTLQATWMVTRPGIPEALLVRRARILEPVDGPDPEALAQAHSRILATLSREIAAELRALPVRRP